ncbi:hypothetical protein IT568_07710 [bacterium]|nr:hypothetical protein [bacterium]
MQGLASQNAPSPKVVIPHFVTGGAFLFAVSLILAMNPDSLLGHYFDVKLLAMTHLTVLGFITMIIFGALTQLIPVIFEVKLFSEKLAFVSYFCLTSGTVLLAFVFWNYTFDATFWVASALILSAVSVFGVNIFLTASRSKSKNIERKLILTSVLWLGFTVSVGVILGFNLASPFLQQNHIELLKLHAHAGLAGWFLQLITGVSSHLLPMFMLSENADKKKLAFSYWCYNFGLSGLIFGFFGANSILVTVSGIVLFCGTGFYLAFLLEAFRKRIKIFFDTGMKQSAFSFVFLILAALLGILLALRLGFLESFSLQMTFSYGLMILFGFVSSLVIGQTYKTLPFIVWLSVYRAKIGKGKIPVPKELYSEKLAQVQFWVFETGLVAVIFGTCFWNEPAVQCGSLLFAFSVFCYLINLFKIAFHKASF